MIVSDEEIDELLDQMAGMVIAASPGMSYRDIQRVLVRSWLSSLPQEMRCPKESDDGTSR